MKKREERFKNELIDENPESDVLNDDEKKLLAKLLNKSAKMNKKSARVLNNGLVRKSTGFKRGSFRGARGSRGFRGSRGTRGFRGARRNNDRGSLQRGGRSRGGRGMNRNRTEFRGRPNRMRSSNGRIRYRVAQS